MFFPLDQIYMLLPRINSGVATIFSGAFSTIVIAISLIVRRTARKAAPYVFSNARRDRIRVLNWERNGLVLWSKRLEQQRFIWPRMADGDTVSMSGAQLKSVTRRI
jgi:hypothetical protein